MELVQRVFPKFLQILFFPEELCSVPLNNWLLGAVSLVLLEEITQPILRKSY